MEKLDKYLELQKEVYSYFGYAEDWVVIPIDDGRTYWWYINGSESSGEVIFANKKDELPITEDGEIKGEYFSNEIYTQRFLPKYVYRGKDYTMICVDTHVDGNKFLQIFDNSKEFSKEDTEYISDIPKKEYSVKTKYEYTGKGEPKEDTEPGKA